MKNNIIFTMIVAIMLIAAPAHAAMIKGYVLIDGKQVPAEYTVRSNNTVSVGSGKNACIPHYTSGFLTVPGEITVDNQTYTVTEIGDVAFRFCNNINGVDIKENVKRIGNFAFVGCEKLSEIILPASLETIGSGAFINTVSQISNASVTCLGTTPPRWEYNDVFCFHEKGISDPNPVILPATVKIYVPENCEDTYRGANYTNAELGWNGPDGWGSFTTLHTGVQAVHIYRPADLMIVREIVNNGKYNFYNSIHLEADIDMTGVKWDWGIGNNEEHPFTGSFYGNGHTISNLTIQNEHGPAGLFSYFGGHVVENVTLKNFDITGMSKQSENEKDNAVGAFAGFSGACTFTNVWVEGGHLFGYDGGTGGILGLCLTTGGATFNECVVKDVEFLAIRLNEEKFGCGGLMGKCYGARVNNCAVIGNVQYQDQRSPFVGKSADNNIVQVKNSYATDSRFSSYSPAENVSYDHVVLYGKTSIVTMPNGSTTEMTIDSNNFKSLLMIPELGLENWVYQDGYYPLPVGFEDKIPVLVNQVTYCPMSSTSTRVNGLMLGSGNPWSTFLDMSRNGYRSKEFYTYRLWIDDEFPYDQSKVPTDRPSTYLPISTATIHASHGVDYDRVLAVTQTGTKPYTVPTIHVDDQGHPVLDSEGNVQPDGGQVTLYETPVYAPTAYSVFLPYQLHHNYTFRLYEPTDITINDTTATIEMDEIDAETIKAWTPYYLIVESAPVDLSTEESVIITPEPADDYIPIGNDYELHGTHNPVIPNEGIFVMDAINSFVQANEKIPAWRTYYKVPEGIKKLIIKREIRLYDDTYNNMTIEDYDGETVTVTLQGRTFVKDGTWYTLCLPFDVEGDMGPLEGATICELDGCTLADGTLSIDFKQVNKIEAGVPYIIKWDPDVSIVNPRFYDVTVKNVETKRIKAGPIYMAGNYMPIEVNKNSHVLYLGDNNRLYYPDDEMTINAFRACFYYGNLDEMESLSAIKINMIPGIITALDELSLPHEREQDPYWYTVDGRVLPVKPTAAGIYIHGGKKVIIR